MFFVVVFILNLDSTCKWKKKRNQTSLTDTQQLYVGRIEQPKLRCFRALRQTYLIVAAFRQSLVSIKSI